MPIPVHFNSCQHPGCSIHGLCALVDNRCLKHGQNSHLVSSNKYCLACSAYIGSHTPSKPFCQYCSHCNQYCFWCDRTDATDQHAFVHRTRNYTVIGCADCRERLGVNCFRCQQSALDSMFVIDDNHYCRNCVTTCISCSERIVAGGESNYCVNCNTECDQCSERTRLEFLYTVGNHLVCEDCSYACESCDERVFVDNNCPNCEQNRVIHPYNYTPHKHNFLFSPKDKGQKRFYGIELEVECTIDRDELVKQLALNRREELYCKHDGSLNNGVEVVTHPGTFRYWMEYNWEWCTQMIKKGCTSYQTETCGMHVHISRDSFRDPAILHRLFLFFRNNADLIAYLSRRPKHNLNKWAALPQTNISVARIYKWVKGLPSDDSYYEPTSRSSHPGNSRDAKYQALNLLHDNTVEVRIFRGTLSIPAIKRNIAVLHGMVDFVHHAKLTELTIPGFVQHLQRNMKVLGPEMTENVVHWVLACTGDN